MGQQKTAKEWTTEQLKLMRWLALPKKARIPKTQRDFAAKIGVHETTLSDWKLIPGFMTEVKRFAVEQIDDHVSEIIAKIVSQALRGSLSHQQMALEMSDVFTPKTRHELTGRDGGPVDVTWTKVDYRSGLPEPDDDGE